MRLFACISVLLVLSSAKANNIAVTNVALAGQNTSAGVNNAANFTYIEFDLSWENSWRTSSSPNNWDAAWVFVKFKTVGGSTWNHVYLAPSGHNSSGTGTSYTVQVGLVDEGSVHNAGTNPAVGAFIYRSGTGTGTFSALDIRLKWFYRDNNVGDNDIIDVDVYAVEMVYVPDGTFWLGNNVNSTNVSKPFYKYVSPGAHTNFDVTSESPIPCQFGNAGSASYLIVQDFPSSNNTFNLPSGFPKGFKGFYCMKYEGSQQQWVDFLNTLTTAQQTNLSQTGGTRTGISGPVSGVFSTTLPFAPKQGNNWPDVAAYLDWAGLRVMTELEFEKACRGTASVVTDEYAWGNTNITQHGGTLTNAGLTSEVSSVSTANTVLFQNNSNNPSFQIRSGSFAKSATSRQDAGASFYGIMDMTGNGYETTAWIVNSSTQAAPTYTGLHGNGALTASGYADVTLWPGLSSGAVVSNDMTGIRGGSWNNYAGKVQNGCVADRQLCTITETPFLNRDSYVQFYYNWWRGVRGVHTKPINPSETK